MLPGIVPLELLLCQTERAAVFISHFAVYPAGFEFEVRAVAGDGEVVDELEFERDLFGRHFPRAGGPREFPAGLLRTGVQFADGGKATSTGGPPHPGRQPAGPVMWPLSGGGGGGSWQQGYWVWPLPPLGSLELVCEWPAAGIALTHREVDVGPMLDAARRARAILPERAGRPSGHGFSVGTSVRVGPPQIGHEQGSGRGRRGGRLGRST